MYKTNFRSMVLTENSVIQPDGFTSIKLINTGDEDVTLNGNVQVATTKEFFWDNHPSVKIDQILNVTFSGLGANPKLVVIQYYCEKV